MVHKQMYTSTMESDTMYCDEGDLDSLSRPTETNPILRVFTDEIFSVSRCYAFLALSPRP